MNSHNLPYARHDIIKKDIEAVTRTLESTWLTQGPAVQSFEHALCKLTGAKHCVAVANGTAALYIACRAIGLHSGDTGLTTSLSFAASANCIAFCGAVPDFVDVDPLTLNMSVSNLKRRLADTPSIKVVIPVDFAGVPADLPTIYEECNKKGIPVIEDAAHAIGSTYRVGTQEYACGSCAHSDLSIFSFHPAKTITAGEGGAIFTNDDDIAHHLRLLTHHGIEKDPSHFCLPAPGRGWPYELQELSLNFRLSDIHSALGESQLSRLASFKKQRQHLVNTYNLELKDLYRDRVLKPALHVTDQVSPCYHLYPIRLTSSSNRQMLYEGLKEMGIFSQVHYWPIHLQPYYQETYGYHVGKLPHTEEITSTCLSLPLFPAMSEKDVKRVTKSVAKILKSRSED